MTPTSTTNTKIGCSNRTNMNADERNCPTTIAINICHADMNGTASRYQCQRASASRSHLAKTRGSTRRHMTVVNAATTIANETVMPMVWPSATLSRLTRYASASWRLKETRLTTIDGHN